MIALNRVEDLKVLVMGDAIMDEYVYVEVVGKAAKESALSSVILRRDVFQGGVWAAAAHVRNFCGRVDVLTGDRLMWNSRLVDDVYLRKLFVTHEEQQNDVATYACDPIESYDLVIVTDFGHGFMTRARIEEVTRKARYLAVNAQTNATNYGYNLITMYPRADFVVLDHTEARLAARDRESPIEDVILALGLLNVIVTLGSEGAIGFDGAFERRDAETNMVVDTMGAGDAFLAVTAPFASVGASMKDLIAIGNAAGAAKVNIVGHSASVNLERLKLYLMEGR